MNKDGERFVALYGEKGLALLIRMMQCLDSRKRYEFNYVYIKEWFGTTDYRQIRQIFSILHMFQADGVVEFDKHYNFTTTYKEMIRFQPTKLSLPSDNYFTLYDYEIDRILCEYNGKEDRYKLLLLFSCIKNYYHTDKKYCSPPIETLAEGTGLSQTTILAYIDILVDIGLLLYANPGTKVFPDGEVIECANIYTMNYPGHQKILDKEVDRTLKELQIMEEQKQLKLTNNIIGNKRRSIRTTQRHLRDRLNKGIISQAEFDTQYTLLEGQYNQLIAEQKSLHNQ